MFRRTKAKVFHKMMKVTTIHVSLACSALSLTVLGVGAYFLSQEANSTTTLAAVFTAAAFLQVMTVCVTYLVGRRTRDAITPHHEDLEVSAKGWMYGAAAREVSFVEDRGQDMTPRVPPTDATTQADIEPNYDLNMNNSLATSRGGSLQSMDASRITSSLKSDISRVQRHG